MRKRRNWHFRKSFLIFVAVLAAALVIIVAAALGHAARRNDRSTPTTEPQTQATESQPQAAGSQPETAGGAAPTTAPTVTPAPVTDPPEDEKVVYLTFDDGPSKNTERILNILDQYGVHATFFVIHSYDGCEAQIGEIAARGNAVGLHSYSHDYSIYSSKQTYFDDLQKISDVVYNATGTRSHLVRFPGGTSNTISKNYCSGIMTELAEALPAQGYQYFDWNWDSTDADGNTCPEEDIYSSSVSAVDNGINHVILLMHDASPKTTTADALPRIIQYYKDAGYRFDVLSDSSYTYHHHVNN